jgi:hypothetical protein
MRGGGGLSAIKVSLIKFPRERIMERRRRIRFLCRRRGGFFMWG